MQSLKNWEPMIYLMNILLDNRENKSTTSFPLWFLLHILRITESPLVINWAFTVLYWSIIIIINIATTCPINWSINIVQFILYWAALVWLCCGYHYSYLSHPHQISIFIFLSYWMPWTWWSMDRHSSRGEISRKAQFLTVYIWFQLSTSY